MTDLSREKKELAVYGYCRSIEGKLNYVEGSSQNKCIPVSIIELCLKVYLMMGEKAILCGFINDCLSDTEYQVNEDNLYEKLSKGGTLLKLLDALQPGCVDWKKGRTKIRHKFDQLNNSNMVMRICTQKFKIRLAGMGGFDIVDRNERLVNGMLWKLKEYHDNQQKDC